MVQKSLEACDANLEYVDFQSSSALKHKLSLRRRNMSRFSLFRPSAPEENWDTPNYPICSYRSLNTEKKVDIDEEL